MQSGLKDILIQVNAPLQAFLYGDNVFSGFDVFGLAVNAYRNDKPVVFPVTYAKSGEGTYVGIEEKPVIIYHKCDSMQPQIIAPAYGDGEGKKTNRYNMHMIVFVDRKKTGNEPDELFLSFQKVFPVNVTVEPYEKVTTNIKNVILNSQQVFNSEYRGISYFVKPEHALFQVDYTIESIYNPKCFNVNYPNY